MTKEAAKMELAAERQTVDTELRKLFMTQLRRYRLAAGLDQKDLASRVGVTVSAVSRWESGKDIPRGSRFQKIARVLGIEPISLTRLIDPEPEPLAAK